MNTRSAFTMVELLVTIAIIVLLMAFIYAELNPFRRKGEAYDSEREIHERQVYKAINDYLWDGNYPPSYFPTQGQEKWICDQSLTGAACTAAPVNGVDLSFLVSGGYMDIVPEDPVFANTKSTGLALTKQGDYFTVIAGYRGVYEPLPEPLASWKLDETLVTNAVLDSAESGADGTHENMAAGSISIDVPNVSIEDDRSLIFDGTNDYVQTSFNDLKSLDDFTISLWFKATTTLNPHHLLWQGKSTTHGWGESGNSAAQELHLSVGRFDQDNVLVFFYGYEAVAPAVEIITPFTDTANWHNFTVVMENAGSQPRAELFLDGVSVGTDTGTQKNRTNWNTDLRLGRGGTAERFFSGFIDEVKIYDVPLKPAQVQALGEGLF